MLLSLRNRLLNRNNNIIGPKLYTNKNWNILYKSISIQPVASKLGPMIQSCNTNLLYKFHNIRLYRKYLTMRNTIFKNQSYLFLAVFDGSNSPVTTQSFHNLYNFIFIIISTLQSHDSFSQKIFYIEKNNLFKIATAGTGCIYSR